MLLDDALSLMQRSFREGRLAHAYLVSGAPRGIAGEFATRVCQLLLCQDAHPPCGYCRACQEAAERTSPDILWIEPEKKSRIIPIATVRNIVIPWAVQTSFTGGWKVIVISFADRFNEDSANAFLKTLEEPPPRTLVLLLTDNIDALEATIISRCHQIELGMGREPPAEPWRSEVGEILAAHRSQSEAGVFATVSQFDLLFGKMEALAKKMVGAEVGDSEEEKVIESSEVMEARVRAKLLELRMAALVAIEDWYRDLCVLTVGAHDMPLHFEEYRTELVRRAERVTPRQALSFVEFASEISQQLNDHNMPTSAVLPYWFGRLG